MRVGLIDVDGGERFPNIALMKISAWHKAQGHDVSWYSSFDGWYDKVYMSKVFSFTPDYDYVINATEINRGGERILHRDCGREGNISWRERYLSASGSRTHLS